MGFHYAPGVSDRIAIRGSFGLFDVLPLPYEFGLNTSATYPYQIVGTDAAAVLGSGTAKVGFDPTKVRNRYVQPDPQRALVMNWSAGITARFGQSWTFSATHAGSRSRHLSVAADDINLVPPVETPYGVLIPRNGTALNPNWAGGKGGAGIRPVLFDGSASYEGLQLQLGKTASHGVFGQLSYSLGNCHDTGSGPVTGDTYANSIPVPLLLSNSYRKGACDFDVRHRLTTNFEWKLPSPTAKGIWGALIKGWEAATIVTLSSGLPFTPTVGAGGDPLGTGFNGDYSMDIASLLPGCNPIHGGVRYLNTNCFTLPMVPASALSTVPFTTTGGCATFGGAAQPAPAGYLYCANLVGNAGRNSLYGPGLETVDFALYKQVSLERFVKPMRLQIRAEAFNLLNHTNLRGPNFITDGNNNSIFDAAGALLKNAGILSSTVTTPRQIQLGVKILW